MKFLVHLFMFTISRVAMVIFYYFIDFFHAYAFQMSNSYGMYVIHNRAVVRFWNPGVLAVMGWA